MEFDRWTVVQALAGFLAGEGEAAQTGGYRATDSLITFAVSAPWFQME